MRVLAFSGGKDAMACLHLLRHTLDCAIYVDTGKNYPETREMVNYAATLLPMHVVETDRQGQNEREGLPSDVVPINWTRLGQLTTAPEPVMVQDYLSCRFQNVIGPLFLMARQLKTDEIVLGQRNNDLRKSTARNGDVIDGMKRLHPIEDWTAEQVLAYLATKMEIPKHFLLNHSSLDCYDCTAFGAETRDLVHYTEEHHPDFYEEYLRRKADLDRALNEALRES